MFCFRLASSAFLLCITILVAEDLTDSSHWARFRGPNGTGIAAAGEKLPLPWDKKHLLWKVPLPGEGNGSPIVWGDHVFLLTASPDARQRHLVCLRVKDGSIVWKKSYPGSRVKKHQKNSYASATPATDGERVYATIWDGRDLHLIACDLTGKEVWKQNLGAFNSQHGAGHSPVVSEGKIFLVKDHDEGAEVRAFDAATGKPRWTKERKVFNACYSTPFVRQNGSGMELI